MDCDPAVSEVAECLGRSLHIQVQQQDHDDELFSLPSGRGLVSAMKGKGEGGPRKLRVKWAPEVYDPIPTLVSHTLTDKNSKKKKKKKNKCKDRDKAKKKKHSRKKDTTIRPLP